MTTGTRETFAETAADIVRSDDRAAIVYAEISGQLLSEIEAEHPERVLNVGIREQLLVSVGAGLALSGLRPIVHTFASFLVERAFEQVKLDFGHQDVDGVLVSTGGSFDIASGGRTHQSPGDVALMDTLPGWSIHVPGTAAEVDAVIRHGMRAGGRHYVRVEEHQNDTSSARILSGDNGFEVVREGRSGVVIAVGPMLTDTLAAIEGMDLAVLHAATVRPFDAVALRSAVDRSTADVVLVEPYLAGTSAWAVDAALTRMAHRTLALGTSRERELRKYGTAAQHRRAHGLDRSSLRESIARFIDEG
ncbi:transketolase family protein [Rudaeicoccus suwonensis]|uniref:Transketolase n=1 Tax=Rudaeicoccus suwonensis TaxID=657409 RepID=A0A561E3P3_9MICO|nr:transketolase [Rudaeicoccus suwonensis]TWE10233.1 transketolase [Rudaeicoccus suwonensis]